MNSEVLSILGTLLSVVVGSLLTYFVGRADFKRARRKEQEEILRGKVERAYILTEEVAILTTIRVLQFAGKSKDEWGDAQLEKIPIQELIMIINLYIPVLNQYAQILSDSIMKMTRVLFDHTTLPMEDRP